jgi:hypothetical protein
LNQPDPARVQTLALGASARHLRYLYPFTTYVKEDGTFSPSHEYAAGFVREFRNSNHDAEILAWIGMPLQNPRPFGPDGWVDLRDPQQRARIVRFAADLIETTQFDGIHFDVEHVDDGDPGYLALLEETKKAIGP